MDNSFSRMESFREITIASSCPVKKRLRKRCKTKTCINAKLADSIRDRTILRGHRLRWNASSFAVVWLNAKFSLLQRRTMCHRVSFEISLVASLPAVWKATRHQTRMPGSRVNAVWWSAIPKKAVMRNCDRNVRRVGFECKHAFLDSERLLPRDDQEDSRSQKEAFMNLVANCFITRLGKTAPATTTTARRHPQSRPFAPTCAPRRCPYSGSRFPFG